ncbi:MAG: hypothetical protein LBM93_15545 [Oscillospiraceae bacterium]|jgi:hypothetical protein|nr:hypothetical protein [Oscillospiraceae bacterium]
MKLNYYQFPDTVDEQTRADLGCMVLYETHCSEEETESCYRLHPTEEWRGEPKKLWNCVSCDKCVTSVGNNLGGLTITEVKKLMKKYGGCGYTTHADRDGSIQEYTDITLGNNRKSYKNVSLTNGDYE